MVRSPDRNSLAPKSPARIELPAFLRMAPAIHTAMTALGQAAVDAGLEPELLELMKLRASQLNGCAFCLAHHLALARRLGLPPAKLDLLAAWRDAGVYTPRELAALAWTDALTELAPDGVSDTVYAAVRAEFSESEVAFLASAIVQINGWNRLSVAFRFTPAVPSGAAGGGA